MSPKTKNLERVLLPKNESITRNLNNYQRANLAIREEEALNIIFEGTKKIKLSTSQKEVLSELSTPIKEEVLTELTRPNNARKQKPK